MIDKKMLKDVLAQAEKKRTELRTVPYLELYTLLDDIKDAIDDVDALVDRLQRAQDKVEEIVLDMEDAENDDFWLDEDEDEDEEDDDED
jgi:adenine C2-methylase RlmN of 23S rRNA A2503 and tRNA A37